MRLCVTATFKNGENKKEIEKLCELTRQAGFDDFCFFRDVENYQKVFNNPIDLMKRAKEEIMKSDALLIDLTNKPTGRTIEAGIAYAYDRKIIVIMKKGTVIKNTVKGIADIIIEYDDISDIVLLLKNYLKNV